MQRRRARGRGGASLRTSRPALLSFGNDDDSSSSGSAGERFGAGAAGSAALVAAAAAGATRRAEKRAQRRGGMGAEGRGCSPGKVVGKAGEGERKEEAEAEAEEEEGEREGGETGVSWLERAGRDEVEKPKEKRESRYIEKLVRQAAVRKDVADAVLERKLVKEREKEDALYGDKERFVTAAYRDAIARREMAEEEGTAEGRGKVEGRGGGASGGRMVVGKGVEVGLGDESAVKEDVAGKNDVVAKVDEVVKADALEENMVEKGNAVGEEGRPEGKGPKQATAQAEAVPLRGLRRNDAEAIEAYRQRYFRRVEARKAAGGADVAPD